MKTKLLFLIIILFAAKVHIYAQFQTVNKDNVTYILEDGNAYILSFDEKATKVTIRNSVTYKKRTYKVAGLKFNSSNNTNKFVQEMVFEEGILTVFEEIAKDMETLERVVLPSTIGTIGKAAFQNCKNLSQIEIPSKVMYINERAFSNCESLKKITLPEGLITLGKGAFSGCSSLEEVILPQSLRFIYPRCFYECSSLQEIVIPHKVNINASLVFYGCTSLTTAIIQCDMEKIPEAFFYGCSSLKSIVLPSTVKLVDVQAFQNCRSLTDIILPNNAIYMNDSIAAKVMKSKLYKGSFFGCTSLTNIKCYDGSVPLDILNYIPKSCPFAQNGGKSLNPDFDSQLLADIAKRIGGENTGSNMTAARKIIVNSDVDISIPETKTYNDTTFAFIIGNENYKLVPPVVFAEHDAKVFAEYCKKTLGLPEKNIRIICDATYAEMIKAIKLLKDLSKTFDGKFNVIFYYSGHGVPNESSRDAFLLPVDADGSITEVCYAVSNLYKELAEINANRILVFFDACFSGSQRGDGVLQSSARGVVMKAKVAEPMGNMVVFSAASGDETAYPFDGKSHGLFTYYLLKKIKETKGDITLGELADYIKTNVSITSVEKNKKKQNPTITASYNISSTWEGMKLYQQDK